MIFRLLIFLLVIALFETYAFQAFKTIVKNKTFLWIYALLSLVLLLYIVYGLTQFDRSVGQTQASLRTMGLLLLVYVPKIVITLILLGEDVYRVLMGAINFFVDYNKESAFLPSRRKFVSQMGLGLAAIPFLSLIYGIFEGRYNYKVIKQAIFFPDLPDAFDGFTITQISDVHSGSFDNAEKIQYAIDLINEQKTDLILFTGDIVNTHAKEMDPWIATFNKIEKHPFGKYAVLGNHDYGEYVT